jgi:drug/metabolite transporter (DMT)-like permease
MGVLFGLTAAICFGVADFFATGAARRAGVPRTLLAVQVVGMLAMGAVVAVAGRPPVAAPGAWAAMATLSAVNFVGMLLLYRAFAIGTLSLVSPIASGFAVVTAGLALATGERPPGLALAGSLLLVLGVTIVSRTRAPGAATLAGVPEAVAVTFCFGLYYWALGQLTPVLGVFWPALVTRLVQLLLALAVVVVAWRTEEAPAPLRSSLPLFIAAGLLDTAALVAVSVGVDRAYTTTTTALVSLYSMVTVVLAWAILRERLAPGQWAGVAVVLAGVLLVSI